MNDVSEAVRPLKFYFEESYDCNVCREQVMEAIISVSYDSRRSTNMYRTTVNHSCCGGMWQNLQHQAYLIPSCINYFIFESPCLKRQKWKS